MSRLYVIVGLIGSGKTTRAKSMPCHYISFDEHWHEKADRPIRGERGWNAERQALVHSAAAGMANVARKCGKDAVIDGWWTWILEWWTIEGDSTLEILKQSGMSVHLKYLPLSAGEAMQAYLNSGRKAGPDDEYRRSIPSRIAYLCRKADEWEK